MREKYLLASCQTPPLCKAQLYVTRTSSGSTEVHLPKFDKIPSIDEFWADYERLLDICAKDSALSYAIKRLTVLEYNYAFHKLLNGTRESDAQKVCFILYYLPSSSFQFTAICSCTCRKQELTTHVLQGSTTVCFIASFQLFSLTVFSHALSFVYACSYRCSSGHCNE